MFNKLKKAYQAIKSDTGVFYLYPSFSTLEEIESRNREVYKRLGKTEEEIERVLEQERPEWRKYFGGKQNDI